LVEIERNVIVGNPYARLSRFVAATVKVARGYASDITVGYGGREADAKRVLESLMVLGKARRGEQVIVRAEGEDAGEAMDALARFLEGE
jgi:phosphocarrier protein HPr